MMNFKREEFIADTSHEAYLNAKEKFGENQFEIIESKKFTVSKYMGMVKEEKHRLVVKVKANEIQLEHSLMPARPLPSLTPGVPAVTNSQHMDNLDIPIPDFITDEGLPKLQTKAEKLTYSYNELHKPRQVNGLRSIQEGTSQPIPQKINRVNEEENSSKMLSRLIEIKNRTRVEPILRSPLMTNPMPVSPVAPAVPVTPMPTGLESITKMSGNQMSGNQVSAQFIKQCEMMMQNMQEALRQLNQEAEVVIKQDGGITCLPRGLQEVKQCLLDMETPYSVAQEIIRDIAKTLPMSDQNHPMRVAKAYEDWCIQRLKFSSELNFDQPNSPKIIALVGPTGVGKTTTIAKLAAQYALDSRNRKNVALFTLDTFRVGAADQLEYYAQHLGSTIEIIYDCSEIPGKLQEHQDKDLIIVDTAGRCQKDKAELLRLYSFLNEMPNVVKYLVLAATSKYTDMKESTENFKIVGYDRLIFTKLDETNSIGPLLAILANQDSPLAYITNGQTVPSDIKKASFEYIYHNLLENCLLFK